MRWQFACIVSAIVVVSSFEAEAGRLGRFTSGMARGAIQGTAHSGARSYATKSYTSEVLTVDQIVACLKKATSLDEESEQLEGKRAQLQAGSRDLDEIEKRIEARRNALNTRSQRDVDSFN